MNVRFCLFACLPLIISAADTPTVTWHKDLGAARKLAKEQKRPLFVVFRCDH